MHEDKQLPLVACTACGKMAIPPGYVCRKCGNSETREVPGPGKGKIYTHTTIRIAPEAYRDQAPYEIAIVELAPGLRVTARIVSDQPETALQVGQDVEFDRIDDWGYWFTPTDGNPEAK